MINAYISYNGKNFTFGAPDDAMLQRHMQKWAKEIAQAAANSEEDVTKAFDGAGLEDIRQLLYRYFQIVIYYKRT